MGFAANGDDLGHSEIILIVAMFQELMKYSYLNGWKCHHLLFVWWIVAVVETVAALFPLSYVVDLANSVDNIPLILIV